MTRRLKHLDLAAVVWGDAHTQGGDWHEDSEDMHEATPIYTVGIVWRHTPQGITLVLSYDPENKHYSGYMFIPTGNVLTIDFLGSIVSS
jgi:hypothetical protein